MIALSNCLLFLRCDLLAGLVPICYRLHPPPVRAINSIRLYRSLRCYLVVNVRLFLYQIYNFPGARYSVKCHALDYDMSRL